MNCRPGCGACCIAMSISSDIPGMPGGKKAGQRCIQLSDDNLCKLFGKPARPKVCSQIQAEPSMCGSDFDQAMILITKLEIDTATTPGGDAKGNSRK